MTVNWPGLILVLVILFSFSITATISPFIVIKLLMRWPKFIFPKLFETEKLRPTTQKALQLVYSNPEEYKKTFGHQLLMMRVTGVVGLLMLLVILVLMTAALLTNN